jgi:phage terminase Nu1 subunit (DNA packaging protein)
VTQAAESRMDGEGSGAGQGRKGHRGPPPTPAILNGLLKRTELAKVLKVHPGTIRSWQADGLPVAERNGVGRECRYSLPDVEAWLAAKKAAKQTQAFVSLEVARTRQAEQGALLKEQLRLTRARELLARAEVERAWGAEITACRTYLLSCPQAWCDRVHRVAAKGPAAVEAVLDELIRQALREFPRGGISPSRRHEPRHPGAAPRALGAPLSSSGRPGAAPVPPGVRRVGAVVRWHIGPSTARRRGPGRSVAPAGGHAAPAPAGRGLTCGQPSLSRARMRRRRSRRRWSSVSSAAPSAPNGRRGAAEWTEGRPGPGREVPGTPCRVRRCRVSMGGFGFGSRRLTVRPLLA